MVGLRRMAGGERYLQRHGQFLFCQHFNQHFTSNMHSLLEHVSIFTVYNLFDTEEKAVKFATEVGLLPHPDDSPKPPCPQCGAECKVTRDKNKKLGFFYTCTKNNTEMCTGTVSKSFNASYF
ncbi:hypothetical protein JTE90_021482 [Oedothorax gibbosus]|uniref:DNA topoisomerase n=1 Tax=Oedothorax gibbosus TaxID=931172 RepID=A0AAV6TK22_9ARAC|nr:hypothetical protein JTE90_021482 [Oedothorax gibbosus]